MRITLTKSDVKRIKEMIYDSGETLFVFNPAAREVRKRFQNLGMRTQYVSLGRAKSYEMKSKNNCGRYPKNIRII